jgi:hypothetical protein
MAVFILLQAFVTVDARKEVSNIVRLAAPDIDENPFDDVICCTGEAS